MRASLALIDNLITSLYRAILQRPALWRPGHWLTAGTRIMRLVGVKSYDLFGPPCAPPTAFCCQTANTHLNGAPRATSCTLMIQAERGAHRKVGRRDLALGGVSAVWDCYHQSGLRLCSPSLRDVWVRFKRSTWKKKSQRLNKSCDFVSHSYTCL